MGWIVIGVWSLRLWFSHTGYLSDWIWTPRLLTERSSNLLKLSRTFCLTLLWSRQATIEQCVLWEKPSIISNTKHKYIKQQTHKKQWHRQKYIWTVHLLNWPSHCTSWALSQYYLAEKTFTACLTSVYYCYNTITQDKLNSNGMYVSSYINPQPLLSSSLAPRPCGSGLLMLEDESSVFGNVWPAEGSACFPQ